MDSEIKLKPCPFCGEKDAIGIESYKSSGIDWFYVTCHECMAQGTTCGTEQDAVDTWNWRADSKISVGDKVYQTDGFNTYESTVKRVLYDTEKITFDADAIGQSVFLTREEAEKRTMHLALEEAENHDEKS